MAILCHMTAKLLTTLEVADKLGIAKSTVTKRVRQGKITPALVLPKALLFDPDHIETLARKES
ncbi:DNA-binding protein [Corynebacterium diphtheriae]|nr:DNA-binding protein [Corynebacterium diphtheriae]